MLKTSLMKLIKNVQNVTSLVAHKKRNPGLIFIYFFIVQHHVLDIYKV